MQQFMTHSRAETVELGRRLAARLAPGTVVAFYRRAGRGQDGVLPGPGRRARLHRPGLQPDVCDRQLLPRAAAAGAL